MPLCVRLFQTVGCRPIASLDHFLPEHLGSAGLVEEVPMGTSKVVKVRGYTCDKHAYSGKIGLLHVFYLKLNRLQGLSQQHELFQWLCVDLTSWCWRRQTAPYMMLSV